MKYPFPNLGRLLLSRTIKEFPPFCPISYLSPPPMINLFLKSGVVLLPSHNAHPFGISSIEPYQETIIPLGKSLDGISF